MVYIRLHTLIQPQDQIIYGEKKTEKEKDTAGELHG